MFRDGPARCHTAAVARERRGRDGPAARYRSAKYKKQPSVCAWEYVTGRSHGDDASRFFGLCFDGGRSARDVQRRSRGRRIPSLALHAKIIRKLARQQATGVLRQSNRADRRGITGQLAGLPSRRTALAAVSILFQAADPHMQRFLARVPRRARAARTAQCRPNPQAQPANITRWLKGLGR